jgi:hypothetical protein
LYWGVSNGGQDDIQDNNVTDEKGLPSGGALNDLVQFRLSSGRAEKKRVVEESVESSC